ncbi:PDZ domain-containing protein [Winogradskyella sp. 3972H.M.0a.05]|uniref:PDZ domain-containing protein n=1 Tax=Winogradskyella sp. 3972H.M.0a.05 TaxID=2950277 RepID=UPI003390B288
MLKKYQKISIVYILLLVSAGYCYSQTLERRASWDANISSPADNIPGAKIVSVESNSPLEKAGFKADDIIIRVDNVLVENDEAWTEMTYGIRSTKTTVIEALRGSAVVKKEVKLNPLPIEIHDDLETYYEEVTSRYGITQRIIITKPNKPGKQPAVVLLGGLSCSSIEVYPGRRGNWVRVINDLVEKSGMVVMRIEKPGVGDSQGDCSKSDFNTDLAGYRAAIQMLKSKPYVDASKIVVYGSSMGSALAPLMANEFDLAGVISDGTFFKTWFEHMLEIERRIREMRGDTESEILKKMNNYYIPLYYGMLIQKKTYKEIEDEYPAIKEFNYHSAQHMYGRPVAYYQQLQDYDLAGEWEKIKAPVRIMRGTNDWIMSSFDNKMIVDVLKKNGHTDHVLYEYPGLDHWNTIHKTPKDSFVGNPGEWEDDISMIIVNWARELAGLE